MRMSDNGGPTAGACELPTQGEAQIADNTPTQLRERDQWVVWRRDRCDCKVPVNARTGGAASTTDPRTWSTFDEALRAYSKSDGELAGIGFVFTHTDPLIGVDLDDCIDDDGNLGPWAQEIVEQFKQTYIEVSPSGHGLKIFAVGRKPDGPCKRGQIECYDRARYFTVTGNRWPETGAEICDCQTTIEGLFERYLQGRNALDNADAAKHTPTNLTSNCSAGSECSDDSVTPEEAIRTTLPTKPGQRNECVFRLARALKFDCGLGGRPLKEMKPIVRDWHARALPYIGTKEFVESWADFTRAWETAKCSLFGDVLKAALQRAESSHVPEADDYDSAPVRLLVALCRQLAGEKGRFFLSTHAAAPLLGVKPMTVYRWMCMLASDDLIEVVEKGNSRRATRYRWRGKPVASQAA